MFPFSSCVSILRRDECPHDWKQINGTLTFLLGTSNDHKRRGAISFERTDKKAIYIRMLGDVKMRGSPERLDTGQSSVLSQADRNMLDNLLVDGGQRSFRCRFMSASQVHRQRRSWRKLSVTASLLLDEFYHSASMMLLSHIGQWKFSIISLDSLSAGRSLFHVGYHLFQIYDLIKGFQLDSVRLMQFLTLVEENYHESNPYHNAVHAADVTQAMHCYLQEREIYESTSDLEKMVALVAALTHDLDHPGVNNTFLIVTCNHLATLYQNQSVLENHHWRSAANLLHETGLLSPLTPAQRESFYHQLKALILATDITRQQEFLLKFTRYIESGEFQYRRNEEHRHFLLQIALKCADISNPCRPWNISHRWSRRICQEFFLQGDTERSLNVAVTPLCDRFGNTIANIQHGFIMFVVSPLFKAWNSFLGTELSAQMMSHMTYNQAKWKVVMEQCPAGKEEDPDSDDGQLQEEVEVLSDNGEKAMEVVSSDEVSAREVVEGNLGQTEAEEEEEEGRSEEDDVVENDVNLIYHYPVESQESASCPVSEDTELSLLSAGINRRFSLPYVRKDLNFYLGLRKDTNLSSNPFHRRQSLPTTAVYLQSSCSSTSVSSCASPRSLSMDALLARPKIMSFSPSLLGSAVDPLNFIPLKSQTLMLQGGTLTRFTTNTTHRRASYEPSLSEHTHLPMISNLPSDLIIPPFRKGQLESETSTIRLASSWPSMTQRRTTNGSTQHHTPSSISSVHSVKSPVSFVDNDSSDLHQQPSTSCQRVSGGAEDMTASSDLQQGNHPLHHPQCLSSSADSPAHDEHNLLRFQ